MGASFSRAGLRQLCGALGASVCISLLSSCSSSGTTAHAINLTGRWSSADYTCPAGVRLAETVDIDQHGSQITATKDTGDDCVHSGHVTFAGTVTGTSGLVAFWTAPKGGIPVLGAATQSLHITAQDQFSIQLAGVGPMVFTRLAVTQHGGGVPGWIWVLLAILIAIVIAIVIVIAFRLFIRRARRRG